MSNNDVLKRINYFSYFFIFTSIFILMIHFVLLSDPAYSIEFKVFVFINIFYYFFVGLGLILKRKWGYYGLMSFVYVLYLAIPVGPYLAGRALRYIEKHDIKNMFR